MKSFADLFRYQSYQSALIYTASLLPACIFSVYLFLYYLFPFIQQKRYGVFAGNAIAIVAMNCIIALFFYILLRPFSCPDCETITLQEEINIAGNNGINVAGFLGAVALGIKFTKNRYLQQVHNRILSRQKITSELKLLKMRIQPGFLFESLQALYQKISKDEKQASELLLKFSELLSYTLYECNDDFVLAEKELAVIHKFIELEKMIKQTKFTFIDISGNTTKKYIPSFILLSLVQNCVIVLPDTNKAEPHYFDLKIYVEYNQLYCIINILPAITSDVKHIYDAVIQTFISRLETFYKNNYSLKFSDSPEGRFMITMSLLLVDNISPEKMEKVSETLYAYTHV
jgi:two-component system, LytTR family, sensor kinase